MNLKSNILQELVRSGKRIFGPVFGELKANILQELIRSGKRIFVCLYVVCWFRFHRSQITWFRRFFYQHLEWEVWIWREGEQRWWKRSSGHFPLMTATNSSLAGALRDNARTSCARPQTAVRLTGQVPPSIDLSSHLTGGQLPLRC